MEHARKYLEQQVKQEAIDEVRDVRRYDEEYLKVLQEVVYTRTEAPAFRIPDETLRAVQQAQEAMQAVSLGITDKALRAMQQQAQGAMQAAVLGSEEGTTERTAQDATISLDSEPEEEPVG